MLYMSSKYLLIISFLIVYLTCQSGCYDGGKTKNAKVTETFDAKTRAAWQKPDVVIDKLGDISDKVIADIGAGTGYFSFRFAMKSKKVIAIDIDKDMLDLMDLFTMNLPTDIQSRIETRLASKFNPKLKEKEVDLIVMINTFSYIDDRLAYLNTIKNGLKEDGQLMILNFKEENISAESPPFKKRISLELMKKDVVSAGYEIVDVDSQSLEYQYVIIASLNK